MYHYCLRNLYANVLTQINAIGCHVQANQKLVKTALQPFFLSHAVHTEPILFGKIWLFTLIVVHLCHDTSHQITLDFLNKQPDSMNYLGKLCDSLPFQLILLLQTLAFCFFLLDRKQLINLSVIFFYVSGKP